MKTVIFLSMAVLSFAFFGEQIAKADSAVSTMAGMLMHLKHHPSDPEKKELQQIIDDKATPENERVIANAMLNMNHEVGDAEKAKLNKMIADKSTPANVRELADVLVNIKHKPTPDDQSRLEKLMK
jgi:hypothetical protein